MEHASEIGSFEAKTNLSKLLRETEQGSSFVILRRGKPVARLVPYETETAPGMKKLIAEFIELRSSIEGPVNATELIEEGRR